MADRLRPPWANRNGNSPNDMSPIFIIFLLLLVTIRYFCTKLQIMEDKFVDKQMQEYNNPVRKINQYSLSIQWLIWVIIFMGCFFYCTTYK